jgi:hypothetical protein
MAFRLHEQLLRGEIDNRERGRVTGTLWFVDQTEPVILELEGNCWRDLAGRLIRITNKNPKPGDLDGFSHEQTGAVGDMTASRRVRIPEIPIEELLETKADFPWHWDNCVYLEWFSEHNGRVVLESVDYQVEVVGLPAWEMSEKEEKEQQIKNQENILSFMQRMAEAIEAQKARIDEELEKDRATSRIEAEADAHDAKMDKWHNRIEARLHKLGDDVDEETYERIMEEETERLRKESGEPDPEPLTPEQEAERDAWVEEMNRIFEEAMASDEPLPEPKDHPVQVLCRDLGLAIFHAIKDNGWCGEGAPPEHPLHEVEAGVHIASAKLAGALGSWGDEERWPPDPLFAGDKLVRLKKARRHLRDALDGMEAAEEQNLATPEWRITTRHEINTILQHVEKLIEEVRQVCEGSEQE